MEKLKKVHLLILKTKKYIETILALAQVDKHMNIEIGKMKAIKEGKLGNAIQLNQIEYAHDSNFQKIAKSPSGQAATDSFNNMIIKNPQLMRGHGEANFELLKLNLGKQIESILARNLAIEP